MAVGVTSPVAPATDEARPVGVRHFIRLKLRLTANSLRGEGWRIALFLLGAFSGLGFAVGGFFLFAAGGLADDPDVALLIAALGGGNEARR